MRRADAAACTMRARSTRMAGAKLHSGHNTRADLSPCCARQARSLSDTGVLAAMR